jgi:inner membrane protein
MSFFSIDNPAVFLWFIAGVILMVAELVVPGFFVIFLGLSAIIVSVLTFIFAIGFYTQMVTWAVLSVVLIVTIGHFLRKMFPSETTFEPIQEDTYTGRVAEVVKKIQVNKKGGQIRFQGSFWDSASVDEEIENGEYAMILSRKGLTFLVRKANLEEVEKYRESQKKNDDTIV